MYLMTCTHCGKSFESISKPVEPIECHYCKTRLVDGKACVGVKKIKD
jgi:DNA-directed RNA polymerase subunit RPC12/RpoP